MITLETYKKTLNILYIEDDKLITSKIKYVLEKYFNFVFIATNGEEALEILKYNSINLIISDINMPIMDGLEFLKRLREINSDIAFIFVTARNEADVMLKAIQLEISNYILKPINLHNFLFIVNKTIDKEYKKYLEKLNNNIIKLSKDFYWDKKSKRLLKDDITIKLTKKELLLLDLLLTTNNKTYSFSEIIYHLWDDDDEVKDNISNLKNMISRLRNKIPELNIENIYGLGYKLNITQ